MKPFRRIICFILVFCMVICVTSGCTDTSDTEDTQQTDTNNTETERVTDTERSQTADTESQDENDTEAQIKDQGKVDLNGKKILIIGNSYVFYGLSVIRKANSVIDQKSRSNDQGYFYQLCKANGYDVSVTDWTFSGHGLYEIFGATCQRSSCGGKGKRHEDQLTDRYFDYVLISPGGGDTSEKNIKTDFNYIMNFFKSANPDVKFVCIGNLGAHGYSSFGTEEPEIYNYYKTLEENGVTIADWGGLVNGIIEGEYKVSGAKEKYSKNTFIVNDGYHPNALAGYITTLMAYCAITGESPLVQPYDFCTDPTINSAFDMNNYLNSYYGTVETNFLDVFNSPSDMEGILQLVDFYLKSKPYHLINYGEVDGSKFRFYN